MPVVRLGTADGQGRPHLVVVTFAVDGDRIYTAVDQKPKSSTDLKRLRNVSENPMVTMLADQYTDDWDKRWWVRADGRAAILADQLLLGSDAFEFSWRYQLPAIVLLPAVGALALTGMAGRVTAARTATAGRDRRTHPASAASDLRAPAAR